MRFRTAIVIIAIVLLAIGCNSASAAMSIFPPSPSATACN